jgi:O-antigen/teichoic acid export membrane protein
VLKRSSVWQGYEAVTSVYSGGALKRAAWQFLTGKAISAILTFAILLWLVRLLPVSEYGAYVVLIASAELGYAIAGLGIPWLTARFIPEYRLNCSGASLARLCFRLFFWEFLALISLAVLIAALLDAYLGWAGLMSHRTAAFLALGLLVAEGLARFEREAFLAPLMLQGAIRASIVLRQFLFLGAIAALDFTGRGSLDAVITAELAAAFCGLVAAHVNLKSHLTDLRQQECKPGWHEPALGAQWKIALRMYVAHLITLASSPQILLIIVQRTLGAEASALFGFLRTLYGQVTQYLPATLLFSVIRPKLMASYVEGGMRNLAKQANLAGKLSLFVLMPLILIVALGGNTIVAILSGNKFNEGGLLLLGLLFVLVPFSQRQLIESVAVAVDRAGLCTFASSVALLALPLMLWLLDLGFGLWAPVLAMLAGQLAFNSLVFLGLAGMGYRPDWLGVAKLSGITLLAWLAASWIATDEKSQSLWWIGFACMVAFASYLFAGWLLKPFTDFERQSMNAMAGRRVFVW